MSLDADGNWHDEPPPDDESDASTDALMLEGGAFIFNGDDGTNPVWGTGDESLWEHGESLIIAGLQGVGKSMLAQQLVKARLGMTGTVLGYPVAPGQRRVLYLAMDRPRQIARGLRRLFTPADTDLLNERLRVWPGPPPKDIARTPELLAGVARWADADTVIVDSIKDAAVGLSDDEVGAGYNRARQYALREGVEVLELHHLRKPANGQSKPAESLADVYGSVWITNGAGSVLLLAGDAGDAIVGLRHLKPPAEEVGPFNIRHDHGAGLSEVWHSTDLARLLTPAGLTAKDAAAVLFDTDKPTANQREKARRRLDSLAKSGAAAKVTGDQSRGHPDTYYPPDSQPRLGAA